MVSASSSVVLLALIVGAHGAVEEQRPVSKVLTLLKDMVGQLQKEAEEDQKVKETMDCWCETGLRDKTQAISDNKQRIGQLTDSIQSGAASSARLSTEIATLEKEVAENSEALEKATAMRKKQLAEFTADEKSMIGSISQMKGAIETIGAKHEGSAERASSHHRTGVQAFLQASTSDSDAKMVDAVVAVNAVLRRHSDLLTPTQRTVASAFVKAPEELGGAPAVAMLQQGVAFSPAHSSSSGAIFGVLKGMKESFETNLEASQKEEMTNQKDYEALKAAKTSEIEAGTNLADTKGKERADTDQKHAQETQDLKDTEATLAADTDFLKNLKEQCATVDAEYAERTKTRNLEIQAVSKALAYLNSDDAADLYARTFGGSASFVQTRMDSSRRIAGSDALAAAALRLHDPRLSALAVRVKSPQDAFDQVRKSIQDMIDQLVTEKEERVKHKDFCVDSIQKNEADTDKKNRQHDDHKYKIGELTDAIKRLTKEIADLKAEIASSYVSLKRAGEDREVQNTDFQRTVADQRATQKLLVGALDILKGFYEKMSLVQHKAALKAPAGAPPPPGFKKYEKNASSGGVMGMMQQIIDDAKAMEAEALQGEEEAQTSYESFVTDLNASIVDMQKTITHKTESKASKVAEKAQKEIEIEEIQKELEELKNANQDLHADCDYTLKNFDAKQGALDDEIMALKESMSIFSGASMSALVQTFKK
jgi:DNA repair exonuclease SbcCD ATPase subunit